MRHPLPFRRCQTRLAALLLSLCVLAPDAASAQGAPLRVVCAERVWCDIVRQIGGPAAQEMSILNSPQVDPHEFAPSPGVAHAMAQADLIVLNGAGFDAWANGLLPDGIAVLRVSDVADQASPAVHLFFDPAAVGAFGRALTRRLMAMRPAEAGAIAARGRAFAGEAAQIDAVIAQDRARVQGGRVASLEPVGQPLLLALGLVDIALPYAHAVMNGTEPAPALSAALEDAIAARTPRVLVINAAFDDPPARRFAERARQAGVPVVQLSEALPGGLDWQGWMRQSIAALIQGPAR